MSRLSPKPSTVKKLFALSGNQCALPDCDNSLVDERGNLIGQICHIDAAEKGGPRYKADQTDEQRRSFENLILLCANHHITTNEEGQYPTKRLIEIKAAHEAKSLIRGFSINSRQALRYIGKEPLCFAPLAELKEIGNYRHLFENNLIYISKRDKEAINTVATILKKKGNALLLGYPAEGKTILSLLIGQSMESQGYEAFYVSFKTDMVENALEDILKWKHDKSIFIVDDVHLNIDEATRLLERTAQKFPSCGLLFVSRAISKPKRESQQFFGRLNLFKELKDQIFEVFPQGKGSDEFENKARGIINKYQLYYQLQNAVLFQIGDHRFVFEKVGRSLHALSLYLNEWPSQEKQTLSKISPEGILRSLYEIYFGALTSTQIGCFLLYLSIGAFELEFESFPSCQSVTEKLSELGIVIERESGFNSFHHAATAQIIAQSYWNKHKTQLQRNHLNFQVFLNSLLVQYIEKISGAYKYPENFDAIFRTLTVKGEMDTLRALFDNTSVLRAMNTFYVKKGLHFRPSIFTEMFLNYLTQSPPPTGEKVLEALQEALYIHNRKATEKSIDELFESFKHEILGQIHEQLNDSLNYRLRGADFCDIEDIEFDEIIRLPIEDGETEITYKVVVTAELNYYSVNWDIHEENEEGEISPDARMEEERVFHDFEFYARIEVVEDGIKKVSYLDVSWI